MGETSAELFLGSPAGDVRKLTPGDWAMTGWRSCEDYRGEGFVKLSWFPEIAFTSYGTAVTITLAEWAAEAFPTPHVAPRLAGDRFEQYGADPTIFYVGPTMSRAITYPEWVAAGTPAPIRLPARG